MLFFFIHQYLDNEVLLDRVLYPIKDFDLPIPRTPIFGEIVKFSDLPKITSYLFLFLQLLSGGGGELFRPRFRPTRCIIIQLLGP